MASSKKYYWKQEMPANRILLKVEEDGTKIFLQTEDLGSPKGFPVGYAIVDEETNKLVEQKKGSFGISAGTKEEYDSLKKKEQSSPSKPQWREEISPAQSTKKSGSVGKVAAADKEPAQAAIEVQSKTVALPEDSKPKVGKRKSADTTEE